MDSSFFPSLAVHKKSVYKTLFAKNKTANLTLNNRFIGKNAYMYVYVLIMNQVTFDKCKCNFAAC